jgi:hypothetical protein
MIEAPIASLSHYFEHTLANPDHATAHVFQQPALGLANRHLGANLGVVSQPPLDVIRCLIRTRRVGDFVRAQWLLLILGLRVPAKV